MFFSVVIPLYNKSYSIKRCIDSVLSQSFSNYEIVVVNDGSTDESTEIVKKAYSHQINSGVLTLIDKKNEGVSVARNIGVNLCASEYICFLDADDEWKQGYLEVMSELIKDFPGAVLYSQAFIKNVNNNIKKGKQGLPDGFRGYVDDFFSSSAKGNVVVTPTACVRKEDFIKVGGFPEKVASGEDIQVWILLALVGRVACDVSYLTIVHCEKDDSRAERKNSVPYPLVFFSRRENIKKNKSLDRYLFNIYYRHFISSLINLRLKEAYLRSFFYFKFLYNKLCSFFVNG